MEEVLKQELQRLIDGCGMPPIQVVGMLNALASDYGLRAGGLEPAEIDQLYGIADRDERMAFLLPKSRSWLISAFLHYFPGGKVDQLPNVSLAAMVNATISNNLSIGKRF